MPLSSSATTIFTGTHTLEEESKVLEDYAVGQRLGEGAYGSVYVATHLPSGASFALKILQKPDPYELGFVDCCASTACPLGGSANGSSWPLDAGAPSSGRAGAGSSPLPSVGAGGDCRDSTSPLGGVTANPRATGNAASASHPLDKVIVQEAMVMQALEHPHVVKLYKFLSSTSAFYFIMELAEGGELFDLILSKHYFQEDEARHYFQQLVSAIDYCHRCGVAHKDLKAENLLLSKSNRLLVCDFGFSSKAVRRNIDDADDAGAAVGTADGTDEVVLIDSPGIGGGCVFGTLHYMSPEAVAASTSRFGVMAPGRVGSDSGYRRDGDESVTEVTGDGACDSEDDAEHESGNRGQARAHRDACGEDRLRVATGEARAASPALESGYQSPYAQLRAQARLASEDAYSGHGGGLNRRGGRGGGGVSDNESWASAFQLRGASAVSPWAEGEHGGVASVRSAAAAGIAPPPPATAAISSVGGGHPPSTFFSCASSPATMTPALSTRPSASDLYDAWLAPHESPGSPTGLATCVSSTTTQATTSSRSAATAAACVSGDRTIRSANRHGACTAGAGGGSSSGAVAVRGLPAVVMTSRPPQPHSSFSQQRQPALGTLTSKWDTADDTHTRTHTHAHMHTRSSNRSQSHSRSHHDSAGSHSGAPSMRSKVGGQINAWVRSLIGERPVERGMRKSTSAGSLSEASTCGGVDFTGATDRSDGASGHTSRAAVSDADEAHRRKRGKGHSKAAQRAHESAEKENEKEREQGTHRHHQRHHQRLVGGGSVSPGMWDPCESGSDGDGHCASHPQHPRPHPKQPKPKQRQRRRAVIVDPYQQDLWSAGVILFFMLTGRLPFDGRDDEETQHLIECDTFIWTDDEIVRISPEARALVGRMLAADPTDRPSLQEIIETKWFVRGLDVRADFPHREEELTRRLQQVGLCSPTPAQPSRRRGGGTESVGGAGAASGGVSSHGPSPQPARSRSPSPGDAAESSASNLFLDFSAVHPVTENEERALEAAFRKIDTEGCGTITRVELRDMLTTLHGGVVETDAVSELVNLFTGDPRSEEITFTQFRDAWVSRDLANAPFTHSSEFQLANIIGTQMDEVERQIVRQLRAAFDSVDTQHSGVMRLDELRGVFERCDIPVKESELVSLINFFHDKNLLLKNSSVASSGSAHHNHHDQGQQLRQLQSSSSNSSGPLVSATQSASPMPTAAGSSKAVSAASSSMGPHSRAPPLAAVVMPPRPTATTVMSKANSADAAADTDDARGYSFVRSVSKASPMTVSSPQPQDLCVTFDAFVMGIVRREILLRHPLGRKLVAATNLTALFHSRNVTECVRHGFLVAGLQNVVLEKLASVSERLLLLYSDKIVSNTENIYSFRFLGATALVSGATMASTQALRMPSCLASSAGAELLVGVSGGSGDRGVATASDNGGDGLSQQSELTVMDSRVGYPKALVSYPARQQLPASYHPSSPMPASHGGGAAVPLPTGTPSSNVGALMNDQAPNVRDFVAQRHLPLTVSPRSVGNGRQQSLLGQGSSPVKRKATGAAPFSRPAIVAHAERSQAAPNRSSSEGNNRSGHARADGAAAKVAAASMASGSRAMFRSSIPVPHPPALLEELTAAMHEAAHRRATVALAAEGGGLPNRSNNRSVGSSSSSVHSSDGESQYSSGRCSSSVLESSAPNSQLQSPGATMAAEGRVVRTPVDGDRPAAAHQHPHHRSRSQQHLASLQTRQQRQPPPRIGVALSDGTPHSPARPSPVPRAHTTASPAEAPVPHEPSRLKAAAVVKGGVTSPMVSTSAMTTSPPVTAPAVTKLVACPTASIVAPPSPPTAPVAGSMPHRLLSFGMKGVVGHVSGVCDLDIILAPAGLGYTLVRFRRIHGKTSDFHEAVTYVSSLLDFERQQAVEDTMPQGDSELM